MTYASLTPPLHWRNEITVQKIALTVFLCLLAVAAKADSWKLPPQSTWFVTEPTVSIVKRTGDVVATAVTESRILSIHDVAGKGVYVSEYNPDAPSRFQISGFMAGPEENAYTEVGRINELNQVSKFRNPSAGSGSENLPSGRTLRLVAPSFRNLIGFEIVLDGARYRFTDSDQPDSQRDESEISEIVNIDQFRPNFRGYDLTLLYPRDFTVGPGVKAEVFQRGKYVKSPGGDWMPLGLAHLTLGCMRQGNEVCKNITSSAEYYKEVSQNIGLSVGGEVPLPKGGRGEGLVLAGKFSANAEFNDELKELASGRSYLCFQKAYASNHVFFIDRKAARLSEDFIRSVHDVVRGQLHAAAFIQRWGTHFPAAIVYGARVENHISINEETQGKLQAFKRCLGMSGEASLVLSGKVDAQVCKRESAEVQSSLETQRINWTAIGGVGGTDAQTMNCGNPRQAVPTYIDMRPIDELLLPPFSDDYGDRVDPTSLVKIAVSVKTAAAQYIASQQGQLQDKLNDNGPSWINNVSSCPEAVLQDTSAYGAPIFKLPAAEEGTELKFVPYRAAEGATTTLKFHARCVQSAWTLGTSNDYAEPNTSACQQSGEQRPCFQFP